MSSVPCFTIRPNACTVCDGWIAGNRHKFASVDPALRVDFIDLHRGSSQLIFFDQGNEARSIKLNSDILGLTHGGPLALPCHESPFRLAKSRDDGWAIRHVAHDHLSATAEIPGYVPQTGLHTAKAVR